MIFIFIFALAVVPICLAEPKNEKEAPIEVTGDKVEYSADSKEFSVIGHAQLIYKEMKLTCDSLKVNTLTKDAMAEGNARLDEKRGVIEGNRIIYNLDTKMGVIVDSDFRANPYFGRAEKIDKVSEDQFTCRRCYFTTCSHDRPHYKVKSKKLDFYYQDKIRSWDDTFYVGGVPLAYLPQYNHSLREPIMHVQLMPGKSKDWGAFLLSAWRYKLTDNVTGRIYADYRQKLGVAEGFGVNYKSVDFGKGDFKYYYTQERSRKFEQDQAAEFQRYLMRLRHKWQIDDMTDLTAEYYKISDSKRILYPNGGYNFLKDYFPRDYRIDSQPLSYILVHRLFENSSLDILVQKRTNRWYTQEEKLPEIKYTLPNMVLGEGPFYFDNASSFVNFNSKNAVPDDSSNDLSYNKFDTLNKISLPTKASIFSLTPFVSSQLIYQDKRSVPQDSVLNVLLSSGTDISTKFYRVFGVNTNFLGLDVNGLRHIITPTTGYSYTKTLTKPGSTSEFGGKDSIGSSVVTLGLSNKLQTKRNGQSVDMVDLNITSGYNIKPKTADKRGSSLQDLLFELKLLPYSWLRVDADTTYKHTDKYSENYRHFSEINYDLYFDFAPERTVGIGHRYQRKGGNEVTQNIDWRLTPKWRFKFYQRHGIGQSARQKVGLKEQEYTISRDLHCWVVDFTYNVKREEGETLWLIFRLKAFPELEFEYNQGYHEPKAGSQSNP